MPVARAGMGSGANNTARYLGAAVGTTLVVLVTTSSGTPGSPAGLLAGWNLAAYGGAALSLLGAFLVAVLGRRVVRVPVADSVPADVEAPRSRRYEWADPMVSAAAARTSVGIDVLRAIATGELPPAPIAATLGFELESVEPGRVVFALDPAEYHYNPIGSVHGGVYATLLDSAAGCAVHSMLPAGVGYTSLDLSVKFLRAVVVETGRVAASARSPTSAAGRRWRRPG